MKAKKAKRILCKALHDLTVCKWVFSNYPQKKNEFVPTRDRLFAIVCRSADNRKTAGAGDRNIVCASIAAEH